MTCGSCVLVLALLQFSTSMCASTPSDCKTGACASQIDDATAMIQNRAKVSHALQMAEDDLVLLMKSSGAGHLLQAEGSERLAATQKMESSMELAVTKTINGDYVAPPASFFEPIEIQMELIRQVLLGEKDGFQTQMETANANVAKCNTNMESTSDGSVAPAQASADALKNTHHTCRVAEKAAYDAKTSSCDTLASETEAVSNAAPQCNCGLNTSDTSAVLTCLASNRNWVDSSETILTTKDDDCDDKTDTWSNKANVCDSDQSSYEAAVCTYAEKLENMRTTLDTCYNDAVSARTSTKSLLEVEVEHLKAMLASLKKIVCFLGVLKKAGTTNITMSDFNTCKNMDVLTDNTYLNNSVPDMDIIYAPAPPKGTDSFPWNLTITPGDGQWAAHEYASYTQEWLRDTAVCPHMTAAPTTPSALPAEMQAALDQHNAFRQTHGAPALSWDATLADQAKTWAERCVFEHSTLGNGENLYAGYGSTFSGSAVVTSWYNEVNDPGYDFNNPGFSSGIGHFTQVVWKSTTKLGCHNQVCSTLSPMGWSNANYFVCMYSPPGNMMGAFAANVLPAR